MSTTRTMRRSMLPFIRAALVVLAAAAVVASGQPAHAQSAVTQTRHNLAPSGPGAVKAADASGVCVYCHTPHDASPSRGLWNRLLPPVTYRIYTSSTTKARIDQPTGSSRLCLSCHDGVLALGSLRASPRRPRAAVGLLKGEALIGTDLSDDHPVSFVYDTAVAAAHGGLADPASLPATVRLDDSRQMQCTSCHDPHEDRRADFLRRDDLFGSLCITCHRIAPWRASTHATSTASWNGNGTKPWPRGGYATVAQNACRSCHRPHAAGHGERLLAQPSESANCLVCHAGNVAAQRLDNEFLKPFRHPVESSEWVHDPNENASVAPRHVTCVDCHNPHAVNSTPAVPPAASGRLKGVPGLTLGGSMVREATFEYEVCLKCHGAREPSMPGIIRQSNTRNIRLKIDSGNRSYHALAAGGRSPAVPGLKPEYSSSSILMCTSCHNSDDWTPAGSAPRGPHGSRFEAILERRYLTSDPNPESSQAYDLCYKCHNRDFLINDQAATFPHRRHVVDKQAPCAVCHDPHGSKQAEHLVDFMMRDRNGKAVVTPSAARGRIEFVSLGAGHGQCWLQCHGVNHEPKSY